METIYGKVELWFKCEMMDFSINGARIIGHMQKIKIRLLIWENGPK